MARLSESLAISYRRDAEDGYDSRLRRSGGRKTCVTPLYATPPTPIPATPLKRTIRFLGAGKHPSEEGCVDRTNSIGRMEASSVGLFAGLPVITELWSARVDRKSRT